MGVGIDLEKEAGGPDILNREWFLRRGRYQVQRLDLVALAVEEGRRLEGVVLESQYLVIAGAIYADKTASSEENRAIHVGPKMTILHLTQLLYSFTYLRGGGSLITLALQKSFLINSEVAILLRDAFDTILPLPGSPLSAITSTYVLACHGFKESAREEGARRLGDAIRKLKNAEDGHRARDNGILLLDGTEVGIWEREQSFIMSHFEPLWQQQKNGIQHKLDQVYPTPFLFPEMKADEIRTGFLVTPATRIGALLMDELLKWMEWGSELWGCESSEFRALIQGRFLSSRCSLSGGEGTSNAVRTSNGRLVRRTYRLRPSKREFLPVKTVPVLREPLTNCLRR